MSGPTVPGRRSRSNPCTISMVAVSRGRSRIRKKVGLKVTRPNVISAQQEDERSDTEQINPSWCLSHKSATAREKRRSAPGRVEGLTPSDHELLLQDKSCCDRSNQARMPSPSFARHTFAGVWSKSPYARRLIHCTRNCQRIHFFRRYHAHTLCRHPSCARVRNINGQASLLVVRG